MNADTRRLQKIRLTPAGRVPWVRVFSVIPFIDQTESLTQRRRAAEKAFSSNRVMLCYATWRRCVKRPELRCNWYNLFYPRYSRNPRLVWTAGFRLRLTKFEIQTIRHSTLVIRHFTSPLTDLPAPIPFQTFSFLTTDSADSNRIPNHQTKLTTESTESTENAEMLKSGNAKIQSSELSTFQRFKIPTFSTSSVAPSHLRPSAFFNHG